MGTHCSCLPCWISVPAAPISAGTAAANGVGTAGRSSRQKAAEQIGNGYEVEVRAIAGVSWRLDGVTSSTTGEALKGQLAVKDERFRTHQADLVLGSRVVRDNETMSSCGVVSSCRFVAVFSDLRAAALVIGGGVAGKAAAAELSSTFHDQMVVVVDPQEYSEYASGIVRAYADPASWDTIVVSHEDALGCYRNVRFVQGEVIQLRPSSAKVVSVKGYEFTVRFDFCVVAAGCRFAPMEQSLGSLWQPSSLQAWDRSKLDERTVAARRRHVVEEHRKIWSVQDAAGTVVVVGADYQSVEWACDLRSYFPSLKLIVVEVLPRCLATLPVEAAVYAEKYMHDHGIKTFYGLKYEPDNSSFWLALGMDKPADLVYNFTGVGARNSFMPQATVSARGPGGGGWILTNTHLQVCVRKSRDRPAQVWADGRIFAVGDCHYGAVASSSTRLDDSIDESTDGFAIPPLPKTAFAAICWAKAACKNIGLILRGLPAQEVVWPNEAGSFVVGLGPCDGVVVWKVKWTKDSGEVVCTGEAAAEMKRRLVFSGDRNLLAKPHTWLAEFDGGLGTGSGRFSNFSLTRSLSRRIRP